MKLVIIKLAAIGDVVMACRALNDWYQSVGGRVEIHWVIDKNLRALAERLLVPKDVVWKVVDTKLLFGGTFFEKAREAVRISLYLAKVRPWRVVILHRDRRYKMMCRLTHFRRVVAVSNSPLHEIDAYKEALKSVGLTGSGWPMNPSRPETKVVRANRVGVLVGGARNQKLTYQEKRWPNLDRFIQALNSNPEMGIVLYGSKDDLIEASRITSILPNPESVENLVGKLSLEELPDSLARLRCFVSIDSGPAHIASMVMDSRGQQVVVLFGPTSSRKWAPRGVGEGLVSVVSKSLECSPCYQDDGIFSPCIYRGPEFQKCMSEISVGEILELLRV